MSLMLLLRRLNGRPLTYIRHWLLQSFNLPKHSLNEVGHFGGFNSENVRPLTLRINVAAVALVDEIWEHGIL
jgi:hypothetical protein